MRVVIDEQVTDMQPGSVAEAISEAAANAEQNGRMIVEVIVDGERWNNEQLNSPEAANTEAQEIRLESAEPRQLVAGTFADAAEALLQADDLQQQAANDIQSGQNEPAMEKLNEAISIWMSVRQAVAQGSQLVGLDLENITVEGTPVLESVEGLNEHLRQMRDALTNNDLVNVSDTLLYELPDTVRQWRSILTDLQQRVQESAAE